MRIMLTCRYLITTMFICIVMQNGYSVNHKMNIICDSIARENTKYNKLDDEKFYTDLGLEKGTILENSILYNELYGKYSPKSSLDVQVTMTSLAFISNMYLSNFLPYDTTWLYMRTDNSKLEDSFKKRFKNVDFAEYDKKQNETWARNPDLIPMKRSVFWNAIFEINRERANPEAFADIEKAIREMNDRAGLGWDDTIYVEKGLLNRHRAFINNIFTNEKEKINPVYLKQLVQDTIIEQ